MVYHVNSAKSTRILFKKEAKQKTGTGPKIYYRNNYGLSFIAIPRIAKDTNISLEILREVYGELVAEEKVPSPADLLHEQMKFIKTQVLSGMNLKEISEKYNIGLGTIRNLSINLSQIDDEYAKESGLHNKKNKFFWE